MSNDKHTPTPTDFFIYKIGEPPVTDSEKLAVVLMTEYSESLRAEKAELIEALRDARTVLYMCENSLLNCGYGVESSTIKSIQKTSQILAKIETK